MFQNFDGLHDAIRLNNDVGDDWCASRNVKNTTGDTGKGREHRPLPHDHFVLM